MAKCTFVRAVRTGSLTIIICFLAVLLVLAGVGLYTEYGGSPLDWKDAQLSLGESERFTEQERAEALSATLEYMMDNFTDCKLLKLSCGKYDHPKYDEELEYVNDLGSHHGKHYTKWIRTWSTVEHLKDDGAGRRKGEQWEYYFYVAREQDGKWEVVTFGY